MLLNLKKLVCQHDLKIKGALHIGAHYGEENGLYQKLNINNVIWFEPVSKNFNILKQNVEGSHLVFNNALGSTSGSIKMYIDCKNQGQSSSVLPPKKHLNYYPKILFTEEEAVDMVRLDDVKFKREDYNFISIDVQGYELEVFKGAKETLKYIDCIITEVNREELYDGCVQVDQLTEFLVNCGFKMVKSYWTKKGWGDALFIK